MKKLFSGLFLSGLCMTIACTNRHKDFLEGTWHLTQMEPARKNTDTKTLLALEFGKEQVISEVRIARDTATFLNSDLDTLAHCFYTSPDHFRIVLDHFPDPYNFISDEQGNRLIMNTGDFLYEFRKEKH